MNLSLHLDLAAYDRAKQKNGDIENDTGVPVPRGPGKKLRLRKNNDLKKHINHFQYIVVFPQLSFCYFVPFSVTPIK